jgi:hypothetical protein
MTGKMPPRDEAPAIEGAWGVDTDPYTDEDGFTNGVPDDVDQPLPTPYTEIGETDG